MEFIVCKFGGTSVATPERIREIERILSLDERRRCVVVSAPGKAPGADVKVTDMLIAAAKKALAGESATADIDGVKKRYLDIYLELGLDREQIEHVLADLDQRIQADTTNAKRFRDLVVAAGEDLNARLFAEYLKRGSLSATYVSPAEAGLVVTSEFGNAQPVPDVCLKLASLKKVCSDHVVVFPGFFGVTAENDVATFSRGGSDLTGAIVAEAIEAVEYENWTDVDGIYSANPKLVEKPMLIPALTYREMRELSYIGFGVIHPEAVWPAMRRRIPIRLRNTGNLKSTGTLIVSERLPTERDVIGIASGGEYCCITVQKYLMNREKGFGRHLLSILENMGLSYEHCPSSVDSISVILDQAQMDYGMVHNIVRTIERELNPDDVSIEYGFALIAVVGEGLYKKMNVLADAADALAKAGIAIKVVNQGSSRISMIFGVDTAEEKRAVSALYQRFFSDVLPKRA